MPKYANSKLSFFGWYSWSSSSPFPQQWYTCTPCFRSSSRTASRVAFEKSQAAARITAYTVWTGIGAVGAFVVGVVMLGEPLTIGRVLAAALIVAGLSVMKLTASA
jgi:hypothetical protein